MTTVLLDFFGTLVDYAPGRAARGCPLSHELVRGLGAGGDYAAFLDDLDQVFATFDRRSAAADEEFSMAAVAEAFLAGQLGRAPEPAEVTAFEEVYIEEWSAGVVPLDGVTGFLADLRSRHRLAIVSNTHSPSMVPRMLSSMGVATLFDAVVLSVDVGLRKPHPRIYGSALAALDVPAADAVFAGDTYDADYAGPVAAGIDAYLIDPGARSPAPSDRRIGSVFELADRLR